MKKIYLVSLLVLIISGALLKSQTVTFSKKNVSCNGGSDGEITMQINGGSSVYLFIYYKVFQPSISDTFGPTKDLNHTFTGFNVDTYFAFVKDTVTGNVLDFNTLIIIQPGILGATVSSTNVNCYNASNGTITISSPTGGSGSYEYSINGGLNWQSSGSYTGLGPATYTVLIRDANATTCIKTLNAGLTITQPGQLNGNVTSTNVTCYNKNNGTITISSPSGGSGSYQYSRNGGIAWQASGNFTGLAPGTYNVVIRDAVVTTCTRTLNGSLVISQPAQLVVNDITIIKGLTCNEGTDGQLRAVVAGGTSPYTYDWYVNNGATWITISQFTQTAINLPKGWYEVRVNDASNCGVPTPATAREFFLEGATDSVPPVFFFDSASVVNTCQGQTNGSITIYAHGGKTPYNYSITTGGAGGYQVSNAFTGLAAGTYETWARDFKGCRKNGPSKTVNTTPNLPVSSSIVANPSGSICPGTSVLFTATPVNGGVTPAYQWRLNGSSVGTNSPTYSTTTLANGDQVNVILTSSLRCTSGNPATSNTITASVLIPPSITLQPSNLAQCQGTNATFSVTALGSGLTYQWRKNGINIGGATNSTYTINNITPADAGNYSVVITGTCGSVTSNNASLTVNTSPVITAQPANIAQCQGTNATFIVTATGAGLTYQWRKNGINIGGATNSTYTISNITPADAGNYSVVITGTCGSVTSNNASLTVNTPPVITVQPANITQCQGTNATFSVTATGAGLTYQWRKNGINIGGATNSTYTINNIAPADAGNYSVVITGTCGSVTSNNASLTVNTPPVITTQPANITQCQGTNATFSVTATGAGLIYQWRKGGVNIGGATNSSYTINNIAPTDAGNYDVVITGTCGTVTSNIATLTVNTPPVITSQPVSLTRCTGTSATFSVTATGSGLTYQWRKNGTNITGATGAGYTIANVTVPDAGNFDVVITGTCGTVTSNIATLTVNTPPVITAQPASIAQCQGTNATFNVTATGIGLTYQWRKGGVNIGGATGSSYTINNIAPADAGNYDVVITGTCGAVTSNTATLTVNTAPVITSQPVSLTRCTGSSATFSVTVTGSGLTYQWRKNGTNITGATGAGYTIASVTVPDAGNFDVVITGTCGTITSNIATLTVNTPPVITAQPVSIAQCQGTNATFSVTTTGAGLTYQWRKGGVNIGGATGSSYTINNIAPADAGNYDVVITGTCGTVTSNTATLTVNTPPVITSQPVSLTRCTGSSATFSVTVTGSGLTYQWRKNGTNITGATSAGYTIASVTVPDAGNFDVVITGTCGTVTSNIATLTVNTPPVITAQPVSIAQCQGTNATFNVTATGAGLTYQWRKGGVNIGGATGSGYTINNITPADAGNYDVVITGTCGTVTSNTVTLTVNLSPSITTQPISQIQCEGTNVSFTVVAAGAGLTYQWRKNGIPLGGATGATYTLINITPASAGNFDVVITGTCGSVTSSVATLTVATKPVITVQPLSTEVCEGSDVSFIITAAGTSLTYQWRKNGTNIAGQTSAALSLNSVTLFDAGNYDVIVYGLCDNITSNIAILTIDPATTIVSQSDDTLVCLGSTVNFTLTTNGFGAIAYQWQRLYFGAWIDLSDDTDVSGTSTADLTIQNIEAADSGYYRSLVSSGCGSVYSDSIKLNVNHIIATIGTPAPFLIDSTSTKIDVGIKVTGRFLLFDLGFALVAPDGTEVMLKGPLSFPCVFNPFNNGVDVTFTTDLKKENGDTIDYCVPVKVITGSYAATGNWNILHGKDPANGAWQVRVYDGDKSVPDPDGFIQLTSLSFTDQDINGDTVAIQYNSGNINVEILNPISGELRPTSYVVPILLMTSCYNSEDARALVTVQGGIAPFSYVWSGPTSVPNSNDVLLGAGTYTVTVTDAMGCSTQATVEVSSPLPITFNSFTATDTLNCHGDTDGLIRVKAIGGTGSLTYILLPGNIPSPVADSGVYTNLAAGTYTLHVEDINNCSKDTTFSIIEPAVFAIQDIIIDSLLCSGDSDGIIRVIAGGGKTPYKYWITPGAEVNNDGIFDNLSQGSYVIRITDASTCGDTLTTIILQMNAPSPLTIDSVTVDPILCNGGRGTVNIHVSGGLLPYEGSIDGGTNYSTGLTFNNLNAGNYTPAVRDNNACITVYPTAVSLIDPPPITIDSLAITDIAGCYGDTTGGLYIAASGGWNRIEYSLDGIIYQTGNLFSPITGGQKSLYIRDSLGCTINVGTLTVNQPPQLLVTVALTHVTGTTPGAITITASGGTPSYIYSIDNGVNTQDTGYFDNLVPGLYYIYVQDANGCTFTDTTRIIINELDVSITRDDVSCFGLSDGQFIITTQNGIAPYWMTGSFLGTDTITSDDGFFAFTVGITAGSYDFRIEDAEGRTYTDIIIINEPSEIVINGVVTNPTCSFNTNDGSIILTVTGGNGGYGYFWSTGSNDKDLLNISEGSYEVSIVDANVCTNSQQFTVTALISVSAFAGPDDTVCFSDTPVLNGSDNGYDSVRWEPSEFVSNSFIPNPEINISSRTEFTYTVYKNQCWDEDTVVMDIYPVIGINITDPTGEFVFDTTLFLLEGQTASLEASAGFDRYLWMPDDFLNNNESPSVICSPLASIRYVVFGITDAGCVETDTLNVVIAQPITKIYSGFTPNGDGYNDKWTIPNAIEYGVKIEVQVFNRWGERIFYSRGYGGSNEWDGTFKEKPLPIGTYYYIITLSDGKTEPFTGTVTIIR